jgi:hypothetical protein
MGKEGETGRGGEGVSGTSGILMMLKGEWETKRTE